MAEVLTGAVPGWQLPRSDAWHAATALFCRANLDQYRSKDGMSIDLDALRSAFNDRLREHTLDTLKNLDKAVKDLMRSH